ncbi:filamentous hemagglutinin N-terminal domain-containing protein, partial [Campylobacter lari]
MKKLANHIILSGVTVSMLFSPLMALPSGGKFTHGTSGSISIDKTNPNKPIMNVSGNGANSVIQWGGGFNIANGEKVNFGNNNFKGQQNYLNIAHGTNKSTIAGILEAGNNNVFLINPNGVIITKTGIINANRFVASTSSMDSKSMQEFADGKLAYNTFSPVFKPNGGNVVNMGSINAKNVTLQGNTVMLSADTSWDDKNNKIKLNQITADSIDLKGNEIYVDISTINSKNLTTEAKNKGIAYLSATGYYYNPTRKYNDIVFTNKGVMDKTYNQYISIGSDLDWWHFAKGWNEKEAFRNTASEYRLTNDIDFKASSGQNYANYWIDLNGDGKKDANEFTNMIVG